MINKQYHEFPCLVIKVTVRESKILLLYNRDVIFFFLHNFSISCLLVSISRVLHTSQTSALKDWLVIHLPQEIIIKPDKHSTGCHVLMWYLISWHTVRCYQRGSREKVRKCRFFLSSLLLTVIKYNSPQNPSFTVNKLPMADEDQSYMGRKCANHPNMRWLMWKLPIVHPVSAPFKFIDNITK